jgi:hypothetical protein
MRIILALLLLTVPALAHDSWMSQGNYKNSKGETCCNENDCKILPVTKVRATSDGYIIETDWGTELIPYKEVLDSQDNNYYRCVMPDYAYDFLGRDYQSNPHSKTRCLFVPKGTS